MSGIEYREDLRLDKDPEEMTTAEKKAVLEELEKLDVPLSEYADDLIQSLEARSE